MTTPSPLQRLEIDGRAVTADRLVWAALGGVGHFTAMQVRGGATRGLGLHLERLDAATRELFGRELDGEYIRGLVRHVLRDDITDASVRVHVHAPEGEPSVTVTVRAPGGISESPQALRSVPYQRPFPHIKHLGGFGQARHGELARRAGFDDALLTASDGTISEGAVTNIGFFDGTEVVWPDAPCLEGVTMRLLEPLLPAAGYPSRRAPVTLADLSSYTAAFVTNARGIAPVRRIDDTEFAVDGKLMGTLAGLYADVPWDAV
ncbi:aminotransferase class IV family protein [Streptomyces sp. SYP-A7185]|uniref:aminotransferase class IV family protein n=1 Tax=Streptomyces sp. SYP-A7185 TaxID=3040076 RepID=UPI0038F7A7CC